MNDTHPWWFGSRELLLECPRHRHSLEGLFACLHTCPVDQTAARASEPVQSR